MQTDPDSRPANPVGSYVEGLLSDAPRTPDPVIPTGLTELDGLLAGGLRQGQLSLIGGASGMGSSMLALNIAAHAAFRLRQQTLVVVPDSARLVIARSSPWEWCSAA